MSGPLFARRIRAIGQFRVDTPSQPVLLERDAHHLWRVLRANDGEEVVVTDGAGQFAFARVNDRSIERVSDLFNDPPPPPSSLYLAPLKGDRSEWAVAKATELGVATIVPLLSERVLLKVRGEQRDKLTNKWKKVAAEAAAQSRRTHDMIIGDPVKVANVPREVAVAQFGGDAVLSGVTAIAIGPEGGWAEGEWDQNRATVGLGATVLRAETAALAAATLLVCRREGWSRFGDGANLGHDEGEK